MARSCQKEKTAEGMEGGGAPRVERSGSGPGTHLPGQLWLSMRQPRTQLVNALHTSEISHTGFAGLACLWLAVCGALQQTRDSSKDLL